MSEVSHQHLILSDGRRLSFRRYGAVDGLPVIALHGTPGFGLKFGFASPEARSKGITLICPDRWGYGRSDAPRSEEQTLARYASDLEELADQQGHNHVSLLAVSGGGPFAVATAAHLKVRVPALGLVAPVGPIVSVTNEGERTIAEMTAFHHFCFRVLPRVPGALETLFAGFGMLARRAPDLAMAVATARAAPADRQLMRNEAERRGQAKVFGGGLAKGSAGPAIDLRIFSRRWNVAFDDISAATQIWQGLADRNVPVAAAKRLARDIEQAQFFPIEKAGHCWIAENVGQVLDWFAESSKRHR